MAWNAMPAQEWFSGDTKNRMDVTIRKSDLLGEFGNHEEGNNFLKVFSLNSLDKIPLKFYMRLYSIARVESMFFGYKQNCDRNEGLYM